MNSIRTLTATALFAVASAPVFAATVDITSVKGVTIGGAIGGAGGKFVPWGGSVVLEEKDAFIRSNGKCAFNVMYDMQNSGDTATTPFKNVLSAKDVVVAINSQLTLKAGESKSVMTQPYLVPGTYGFSIKLDADNNLAESNETNNVVGIKVTLNGTCGGTTPESRPTPKPDVTSQKGIVIGSHTVPWNGMVTLTSADAVLTSNGKCAFNISYDLENIGAANAGAFANKLYARDALVGQQSFAGLDKGASKIVTTQAYLQPGVNALRLEVDANKNVDEVNEGNNVSLIVAKVDSTCTATTTTTRK